MLLFYILNNAPWKKCKKADDATGGVCCWAQILLHCSPPNIASAWIMNSHNPYGKSHKCSLNAMDYVYKKTLIQSPSIRRNKQLKFLSKISYKVKDHPIPKFDLKFHIWATIPQSVIIGRVKCTINSKINGTPKGVYLPISKLHSILAVPILLAHNNITISF